MDFTSTGFVLLVAAAILVYYLLPEKKRWGWLLFVSYGFYACASPKGLVYLASTTLVSYLAARRMQQIQDACDQEVKILTDRTAKKERKATCKRKKKRVLTYGLLFCLGLLAVVKYTNFLGKNLEPLIQLANPAYHWSIIRFFIPLGLSFYTFSVASYLFDVYYHKYPAETNLLHYALYVSWFPALVQGPISRNNDLRHEFFEKEHPFDLKQTEFALQRMLWGFFKKLVIADRAAQVVTYIWDDYATLPWYIIAFGLFMYAIQQYADFAGGMDIALGVSELFGINLKENFRQPYFSKSIAEFWRRWHITLGTWMKDYIFYPFAVSKTALNLGKKLGTKSKYLGRVVPMCLGNILVFLLVGIWHGAEWHFVWYGVFHGGIIALSIMLEPCFKKWITVLRINTASRLWLGFQILRTFILVNLGGLLDDVTDMKQSIGMTKQLFTFTNGSLITNFSYQGFGKLTLVIIFLGSAVWFVVSLLKEKNVDVREAIARQAIPVRWIIYLALLLSVPFLQSSHMAGFMYAQF